jgi:hypothetical protein
MAKAKYKEPTTSPQGKIILELSVGEAAFIAALFGPNGERADKAFHKANPRLGKPKGYDIYSPLADAIKEAGKTFDSPFLESTIV